MTTDELIQTLRKCVSPLNRKCDDCPHKKTAYPVCAEYLMNDAAYKLEEQDKIIKQYQKADCFLAAHGGEWEEGGCWYDD